MNFVLELSLKHNALVKVAATLWNQCDIKFLVAEFSNSDLFLDDKKEGLWIPPWTSIRTKKWKEIENKVFDKMEQLIIPKSLKVKITSFIQLVGSQILRWMEYHRITHLLDLDLPNEFYWSSCGTIDKRKTATVLVNDKNISIKTRYKLACIYCLEEDILKLWDEIPDDQRTHFYDVGDLNKVLRHYLVILWTCIMKGQLAKIKDMIEVQDQDSVYRYSFQYAVDCGNKAAAEYFLQKISPSDTSSLMMKYNKPEVYHTDIGHDTKEYYHSESFFFLLSQLNEKQQEIVFENYYHAIFHYFLDWPFQCFFAQATPLRHISTQQYVTLAVFRAIYKKVLDGYEDYDYEKMFREFWQQLPEIAKNYLSGEDCLREIIKTLLFTEHEENMRLILSYLSEKQKEQFLFSYWVHFCKIAVYSNSLRMINVFIRSCVSSRYQVIVLKQKMQGIDEDVLKPLYKTLDDLVPEYDKRKCENEENIANSAKKIRNVEFDEVKHAKK